MKNVSIQYIRFQIITFSPITLLFKINLRSLGNARYMFTNYNYTLLFIRITGMIISSSEIPPC